MTRDRAHKQAIGAVATAVMLATVSTYAAAQSGATTPGRVPSSNPSNKPEPSIYNGRENRIAVQVPRLSHDVHVDGSLAEPAWVEAAVLTGFSQYRPVDGVPAEDSTEVLVWYADHEIHFGVRAFEPHGLVNASLADRDRIGADDYVTIFLDTFNDRRRALVFSVNPFGVQADGIWNESAAPRHGDDSDRTDLAPDFVYESRGRLTNWGWEVEIRIPFKSLRYQPQPVQTWGINIVRRVQHSGHQQTWTAARRGANSFLAQSGTLEQLADLRRGLVLDVNPVVTPGRTARAQPRAGSTTRRGPSRV
jgi:hypothetical protein